MRTREAGVDPVNRRELWKNKATATTKAKPKTFLIKVRAVVRLRLTIRPVPDRAETVQDATARVSAYPSIPLNPL